MKIIDKSKQFVKNNWVQILTTSCVVCGGIAIYRLGFKSGMDYFGNKMGHSLGINLRREWDCCSVTHAFRDIIGDEMPEGLLSAGYNDLDEKVNIAIIIQKIES